MYCYVWYGRVGALHGVSVMLHMALHVTLHAAFFRVSVTLHALAGFCLSVILLIDQQHGVFLPIVQLHVPIQPTRLFQRVHKNFRLPAPLSGVGNRAGAALAQIAAVGVLDRPCPETDEEADGNHVRVKGRAREL